MTKKEIRKQVLKERRSLSPEIRAEKSRRITELIINTPMWKAASSIFPYVPLDDEVDTRLLIEKAWEEGKTVAVPKVIGDTMIFSCIHTYDELEPGYMGILEPKDAVPYKDQSSLVFLPGSVFDIHRNRIGYGGGFYDRFLAAEPSHPTCALAFDLCVLEEIPTEEFDIRPQMIVTESRVITETND